MATPIQNREKAVRQLQERVHPGHAEALLNLPKRALAAALIDLAALHNDSNADDHYATGEAALKLAESFK